MRILPILLVGASALVLSACDELAPRKAPPAKTEASADCCCQDRCPNPPKAPVVGTPREEGVAAGVSGGQVRRVSHEGRGGYRHRARSGTEGVGYLDESAYRESRRSGTEGVGYLDEGEYSGAYRRVGGSVSVEARETYSESARYAESSSGYSYSSGGAYSSDGGVVTYDGRGRGHGRRGGGYAGVDRDGYLTWPGKTE